MKGYAILVIWNDGKSEYIKQGLGSEPARFRSRSAALDLIEVMRTDEFQSMNVVPFPTKRRARIA